MPDYHFSQPVYSNEVVIGNQIDPTSFNTESSYSDSVEVDVEDSDGQEQNLNVAQQLIASAAFNQSPKTKTLVTNKKKRAVSLKLYRPGQGPILAVYLPFGFSLSNFVRVAANWSLLSVQW